jgi:hypothetical protein
MRTGPLVGQGYALPGVFLILFMQPAEGRGLFCEPESGSPRTPAGHGLPHKPSKFRFWEN